jgi:hypothetical protein
LRVSSVGLMAVVAGLSLVGAGPTAAQSSGEAVELVEGVLVESGSGLVLIMNPAGGIDALRLRSGAPVWRSEAAALPLAVVDGRLLALAEPEAESSEVEIVTLDILAGRGLSRSAIRLPDDVTVSIDDTLQGRFDLDALSRFSDAVLQWSFEPERVSGEAEEGADYRMFRGEPEPVSRGALTFRYSSGQLDNRTMLDAPLKRDTDPRMNATGRPRVDGRPGVEDAASRDGAFVMESLQVADTGPEKFVWTISNAETGERIGSIRTDLSYAPFVVSGGLVIHQVRPSIRVFGEGLVETPLSVRAVSLTNGEEVWIREMRDTDIRGELPP